MSFGLSIQFTTVANISKVNYSTRVTYTAEHFRLTVSGTRCLWGRYNAHTVRLNLVVVEKKVCFEFLDSFQNFLTTLLVYLFLQSEYKTFSKRILMEDTIIDMINR